MKFLNIKNQWSKIKISKIKNELPKDQEPKDQKWIPKITRTKFSKIKNVMNEILKNQAFFGHKFFDYIFKKRCPMFFKLGMVSYLFGIFLIWIHNSVTPHQTVKQYMIILSAINKLIIASSMQKNKL